MTLLPKITMSKTVAVHAAEAGVPARRVTLRVSGLAPSIPPTPNATNLAPARPPGEPWAHRMLGLPAGYASGALKIAEGTLRGVASVITDRVQTALPPLALLNQPAVAQEVSKLTQGTSDVVLQPWVAMGEMHRERTQHILSFYQDPIGATARLGRKLHSDLVANPLQTFDDTFRFGETGLMVFATVLGVGRGSRWGSSRWSDVIDLPRGAWSRVTEPVGPQGMGGAGGAAVPLTTQSARPAQTQSPVATPNQKPVVVRPVVMLNNASRNVFWPQAIRMPIDPEWGSLHDLVGGSEKTPPSNKTQNKPQAGGVGPWQALFIGNASSVSNQNLVLTKEILADPANKKRLPYLLAHLDGNGVANVSHRYARLEGQALNALTQQLADQKLDVDVRRLRRFLADTFSTVNEPQGLSQAKSYVEDLLETHRLSGLPINRFQVNGKVAELLLGGKGAYFAQALEVHQGGLSVEQLAAKHGVAVTELTDNMKALAEGLGANVANANLPATMQMIEAALLPAVAKDSTVAHLLERIAQRPKQWLKAAGLRTSVSFLDLRIRLNSDEQKFLHQYAVHGFDVSATARELGVSPEKLLVTEAEVLGKLGQRSIQSLNLTYNGDLAALDQRFAEYNARMDRHKQRTLELQQLRTQKKAEREAKERQQKEFSAYLKSTLQKNKLRKKSEQTAKQKAERQQQRALSDELKKVAQERLKEEKRIEREIRNERRREISRVRMAQLRAERGKAKNNAVSELPVLMTAETEALQALAAMTRGRTQIKAETQGLAQLQLSVEQRRLEVLHAQRLYDQVQLQRPTQGRRVQAYVHAAEQAQKALDAARHDLKMAQQALRRGVGRYEQVASAFYGHEVWRVQTEVDAGRPLEKRLGQRIALWESVVAQRAETLNQVRTRLNSLVLQGPTRHRQVQEHEFALKQASEDVRNAQKRLKNAKASLRELTQRSAEVFNNTPPTNVVANPSVRLDKKDGQLHQAMQKNIVSVLIHTEPQRFSEMHALVQGKSFAQIAQDHNVDQPRYVRQYMRDVVHALNGGRPIPSSSELVPYLQTLFAPFLNEATPTLDALLLNIAAGPRKWLGARGLLVPESMEPLIGQLETVQVKLLHDFLVNGFRLAPAADALGLSTVQARQRFEQALQGLGASSWDDLRGKLVHEPMALRLRLEQELELRDARPSHAASEVAAAQEGISRVSVTEPLAGVGIKNELAQWFGLDPLPRQPHQTLQDQIKEFSPKAIAVSVDLMSGLLSPVIAERNGISVRGVEVYDYLLPRMLGVESFARLRELNPGVDLVEMFKENLKARRHFGSRSAVVDAPKAHWQRLEGDSNLHQRANHFFLNAPDDVIKSMWAYLEGAFQIKEIDVLVGGRSVTTALTQAARNLKVSQSELPALFEVYLKGQATPQDFLWQLVTNRRLWVQQHFSLIKPTDIKSLPNDEIAFLKSRAQFGGDDAKVIEALGVTPKKLYDLNDKLKRRFNVSSWIELDLRVDLGGAKAQNEPPRTGDGLWALVAEAEKLAQP